MDIYWYARVSAQEAKTTQRDGALLLPPQYDFEDELVCCSEGIAEYTDALCCGGCVPYRSIFPLAQRSVQLTASRARRQEIVPNDPRTVLSIVYGKESLTTREIKGWKGIVCGYHVHPGWFKLQLLILVITLLGLGHFVYNRWVKVARQKRT